MPAPTGSPLVIAALALAVAGIAGAVLLLVARARGRARRRRFVLRHHASWARTAKRHKVLLVAPTLVREDGTPVKQPRLMLPALNVALLAGLVPDDWDVEIVYETIEEVPFDTDADLVGISGMGVGLWHGLELADRFRARGKKVVVGGPMATLVPQEVLPRADAVCVGDAEEAWPRILADFAAGRMSGVYRGEQPGVPRFPVPRYDLVAAKSIGWFLPVQVGRGCPHHCDFCSIAAAYGGRYHRRDIADVVRDIRAIRDLGFRRVLLLDDNLAADKAYAMSLFAAVEPLGVEWMGQTALSIADYPDLLRAARRSGCTTLSFGLESVNQASLESVGKAFARVAAYERQIAAVRAAGIEVSTEMILGLDGDGPDTFARTAEFTLRSRITLPRFYVLTPVPGTPLHARLDGEDRIIDRDFGHYNAARVVHRPAGMTAQELQRGYWEVYDRVFTRRAILDRVLGGGVRRPLGAVLFLLLVNLHYRRYVRRRICPGMV